MTKITMRQFGITIAGEPVQAYVLDNGNMSVDILEYGCTIRSVLVPDQSGTMIDVVLGFDDLLSYEKQDASIGCVVGRYANRIKYGRFSLNGKEYQLAINNGQNHLHGGNEGFNRKVWKGSISEDGQRVILCYFSKDGEENYPGNLTSTVTYSLTSDNGLKIEYHATTDQPTIVNLTNHSYFNLAGADSNTILDHTLEMNAVEFAEVAQDGMPTGRMRLVEGTPLDLRTPTTIGEVLEKSYDQLEYLGGLDHCFAVGHHDAAHPFARMSCPATGISLSVLTSYPGMQVYDSQYLDGSFRGKQGIGYAKHCAVCLETQFFPDSINQALFAKPILKPGETYSNDTIYRFEFRN